MQTALLIEDNPADARLIRALLAEDGDPSPVLVTASRLAAGLGELSQAAIDIILLDLSLPDSRGLETVERVISQDAGVPIIVLTGLDDHQSALQALQAGAQDYLVKGQFDGQLLRRTMRYAIERQRLNIERQRLTAEMHQRGLSLQASEARTRQIILNNADGMLIISHADQILFANPAAAGLFGCDEGELIGQTFGIKPVSGETVELSLPSPGGGSITAEMRVTDLDWNGEPAFLASLRDVTERKKAQAALEEALTESERLRDYNTSILETMAEGLALEDVQGRFTLVNSRLAQMLGYAADELVGQPWTAFVAPDELPGLAARVGQRPAGQSDLYEAGLETRNGRLIPVLVSASPLYQAGQFSGTVVTFADLTEQKKREHELQAMADVSLALRGAASRADMVPLVLEQLLVLMVADGAALAIRDAVTDETLIEGAEGQWRYWLGERLPPGEGPSGQVIAGGQPFVSNALKVDPLFGRADLANDFPAVAGAPMTPHEKTIGALWVGRRTKPGGQTAAFSAADLRLLTAIGDITANAIQRATLLERTHQQLRRLNALRTIDRSISSSFDLHLILRVLLDQVADELQADAAQLLLLNPAGQTLEHAGSRGFRTEVNVSQRLELHTSRAGRAALYGETVAIPDLTQDQVGFTRSDLLEREGFLAYFAAPLTVKGTLKGVLEVFQRRRFEPDLDWLGFLETLAGQAAIAVDNTGLFDNLKRSNLELSVAYDATIEGWSRALDLRDKETEGHTQRVTEVTMALAQAMGLPGEDMINIRRGALLHDIGKMGVPDAILLKPGPLNDEEWIIMRQHPMLAYRLLAPIAFLRPALDIPYCHHEKWDGTGYPRGLKGEEIPLTARVFAVVDVWDALRSDRPYRKGWSEAQGREYIGSQLGKHFDPHVAEAFLRLLDR